MMASLGEIEFMRNNLKTARKPSVEALHKFIYEEEGDRNNRQRLRGFAGFECEINSEIYNAKSTYVTKNLTQRDLVSICIMLGISYDTQNLYEHIFRNLIQDNLLKYPQNNQEDEQEVDDLEAEADTDEDYDDQDEHFTTINDKVSVNTNSDAGNQESNNGLPTVTMHQVEKGNNNPSRFALSFRDIEETVKTFDGNDDVRVWISEFEETAAIMQWDNFQKLVFAKRMLKGIAALFVKSERAVSSWQKLKTLLLEGFSQYTNSAQIHQQMIQRKMKKDESVQEYYLKTKEIASRGRIEEQALIQYVIDGIADLSVNKTILYGCKNAKDFKEKLKLYQIIRDKEISPIKEKTVTQIRNTSRTPKDKEVNLCFNCGSKGHISPNCPNKGNGRKCFNCNQFGHIGRDCPKKKEDQTKENTRTFESRYEEMTKEVKIKEHKFVALFDTGSKFNLMSTDVYRVMQKPELKSTRVRLVGFGKKNNPANDVIPLGKLTTNIEIHNEVYKEDFLVVSSEYINVELILGAEFCKNKEIKMNEAGIHCQLVTNDNNINDEGQCKIESNDVVDIMKIDCKEEPEYDIDPNVSLETKEIITMMIRNYKPKYTKTTNVVMKIILSDETPIACRTRRLPIIEQKIVDEQIEQWLEEGIIEESESEFSSPVLLVHKKDGDKRLCVDNRRINKVMIKDRFPLPLIDDQLDRLQNAKVFSTLDLKMGFSMSQ